MKVLFRPGPSFLSLSESMAQVKEFNSVKAMFEYLVQQRRDYIKLENLYIKYYHYDERIDWDTYLVCDGSSELLKKYGCPQAMGFCTFKG